MAHTVDILPKGRKRRLILRVLGLGLLVLLLALAIVWFNRNTIADDLIGDALRDAGVEASYTVERISPEMQVLRDVVIGDPARPDFTAERIEIDTALRFGLPDLRQVRVIGARLFGSYHQGVLSFGALDPLIFTEDETPFAWPDLDLAIADGRGLIDSDYGRIGVKLTGSGHLQDGFVGELAAAAPALALGDCSAARATLFGQIRIDEQRPRFTGPLRFSQLACGGATLAGGAVQLDGGASPDFAAFDGKLALRTGAAELAGSRAATLGGEGTFHWAQGRLITSYDLALGNLVMPFASFAELALEGRANAGEGFAMLQTDGELRGSGIRLGGDLDGQLAGAMRAANGTLLAPLLARLRGGLSRELRGASLAASYTARRNGGQAGVVVPQASLRGGSGASLLALSRVRVSFASGGLPRFEGNFATGGDGLPRLAGRMEQAGAGPLTMRLRMSEYAAGDARLAVPEMALTQSTGGQIRLAGQVLASGPLPGGYARGLAVPVDGVIGADGAISPWQVSLGQGCRAVRFDSLRLANLSLGRQSLLLCPPRGLPILRYSGGALRIAAGSTGLTLRGTLGETPITVATGPVGFSWPGRIAARNLAITLGQPGAATRFVVSDLAGDWAAGGIAGRFAGADVFLAPVPLDILQAGGTWRYAGGQLSLAGASFMVQDREEVDRFKPMQARDASLTLASNVITANAVLHETSRDTAVARVDIVHDLGTAAGHADLVVEGIAFRPQGLQPRDLSELAYGVVSLVDGSVSGTGRIDWGGIDRGEGGVRSTGQFSSTALDFAAPFGPVKGASGTVRFTDLLGLTTAPDQRIAIAAINPGIEIFGGELGFQLRDGRVVEVTGGTWPFLGGTLRMRPVTLNIGVEEIRTYVIEIEGLEAARFIERMELNNLSASGVFDGTIPIVFDAAGNGRLQGGLLTVRPPGGNLSYVGQLSYEDMSFFSNLTFSALRDLRFSAAEIRLDGPLTGELVTKVNFEGIGQGESATSNFLIRQIARLPIRLRINIRAPFYQLISTTRSLYDPSAVRDPRGLGLIAGNGRRLREAVDGQTVEAQDALAAQTALAAEAAAQAAAQTRQRGEPDIQPPESEALP